MIVLFLGLSSVSGVLSGKESLKIISTVGHNIWNLCEASLSAGSHQSEFIGATYDGKIVAYNLDGTLLWEIDREVFAFDLAVRDINNDGLDEIFAALSDGQLLAVDAKGKVLFCKQITNGLPLYEVAVWETEDEFRIVSGGVSGYMYHLNVEGEVLNEKKEPFLGVIRFLTNVKFSENDQEYLLASSGNIRNSAVICWASPGEAVWKSYQNEIVQDENIFWNQLDKIRESMTIFPITKKNNEAIAVKFGGGKLQPFLSPRRSKGAGERRPGMISYDRHGDCKIDSLKNLENFDLFDYEESYQKYCMYISRGIDYKGKSCAVVLCGDRLILVDKQGNVLKAATASQGFSSLGIICRNKKQYILLGGAPNGDDRVYLLPLMSKWKKELENIPPGGLQEEISSFIGEVSQRIDTAPHSGIIEQAPTDIIVRMYRINTLEDINFYKEHIRDFLSYYKTNFPSPAIRYGVDLWIGRGSGRQMTEEELLDFFLFMEENDCYFNIFVSHGCNFGPSNTWFIPVSLAKKIASVAPTSFMGLYSGEDEHFNTFPTWFSEYWTPMIDLADKTGIDVYMKEKNVFWFMTPAMEMFQSAIYQPQFGKKILATTEDSNSRTPDLNLAGRLGLWYAGAIDRWGTRLIGDAFSFNRQYEWEYPMVGHPSLRSMIVSYALGADHLMFEHGQFGKHVGESGDWDFNRVWYESDATFLKLISKGLLLSPDREHIILKPVAVKLTDASERFIEIG
ncbi:MAG: hypothetical protein PF450_12460, partial [Bacteroidales bacterium]|nr:hypothetical protein [Bacteroidales bacterium]